MGFIHCLLIILNKHKLYVDVWCFSACIRKKSIYNTYIYIYICFTMKSNFNYIFDVYVYVALHCLCRK